MLSWVELENVLLPRGQEVANVVSVLTLTENPVYQVLLIVLIFAEYNILLLQW